MNNAPSSRITLTCVEAKITSEHYFTASQGVRGAWLDGDSEPVGPTDLDVLTFCVLVLRNGFTVTGESACASSENFDAGIGKRIARANAVQKLWPLMGYQLKQELFEDQIDIGIANERLKEIAV